MADIGYLRTLFTGLKEPDAKRIFTSAFEYLLGNLRLGAPDHQMRAENLQAYWEKSTSASDTGEFSFAHGLTSTPRYAIPVLDLNTKGAKVIPLEVSRVADGKRIYLKTTAGSTNAPILLLIE